MTATCNICPNEAVVQCSRCNRCMCELHAIIVGDETLCNRCARRDKAEYAEGDDE